MAAGIPIIATDVGGITDVIKNKFNGIVIPQKDEEMLAESIISILNNNKDWDFLSKNATATSKSYSWATIGKKYIKLIQTI
jgi:glycosyltransferase involved in cell wall biosynthesis